MKITKNQIQKIVIERTKVGLINDVIFYFVGDKKPYGVMEFKLGSKMVDEMEKIIDSIINIENN